MNYDEIADMVHDNLCSYCRYEQRKYCCMWDICTARLMEILAVNMIGEGDYI